jgi:hypothetical protein
MTMITKTTTISLTAKVQTDLTQKQKNWQTKKQKRKTTHERQSTAGHEYCIYREEFSVADSTYRNDALSHKTV